MEDNKIQAQRIDKESVNELRFPLHEVLTDGQAIEERKRILHRATSLGNLERH
jgi:hypothetical protein